MEGKRRGLAKGLGMAAAAALLVIVLAGCETTVGYAGNQYAWGGKGKLSGTYKLFNSTKDSTIRTDAGETVVLEYASKVKKGSLKLRLDAPDGTSTEFIPGESGTLEVKSSGGSYHVHVEGKNTGGSFELSWKVVDAKS